MPTFNNRRKSSQRKKKSRPFGTLTIDTKCASQGKAIPYESRIPGLSFVSYEESKQRKAAQSRDPSLKETLENSLPIRPGPKQTVPFPISQEHLAVHGGPKQRSVRSLTGIISVGEDSSLPPAHMRIKGLRPPPLDLSQDVSPLKQAITIGLALSPSIASARTKSPTSIPSSQTPPTTHRSLENSERQGYRQDVATPIIVITPAKDHFSPEDLPNRHSHRPASSVYSRCTNCMPKKAGSPPPVPPLPFFAGMKSHWSQSTVNARESVATVFEEDSPSARALDASDPPTLMRQSRLATTRLPTPRRSKGWWNVITSPFSAKSTGTYFWRSPLVQSDLQDDSMPILSATVSPGTSDPYTMAMFTDLALDHEGLRSAPPMSVASPDLSQDIKLPQRSNTASGALESNTPGVNIYRIPSSGEAAAYFDPGRHFPSLCEMSRVMDQDVKNDLTGWSPSQSVFIPDHSSTATGQRSRDTIDDGALFEVSSGQDKTAEAAHDSPASEVTSSKIKAENFVTQPFESSVINGATIFSTPTEDELESAGLSRVSPTLGSRKATSDSVWSPLPATPVVRDAPIARMVGPHSSIGEQREVEVTPTPSQHGLRYATPDAATTVFSKDSSWASARQYKDQPLPSAHIRQDSRGLGISNGESEHFPSPQPLSEKPRLGTDKFGQLTIHSMDEDKISQPWYRRFFWPLAAGCCAALLLMIVFLAIFVPQRHDDVPVQASWINLTGFPALSVGVSTIIQPGNSKSLESCVSPSVWSCAVPGQQNGSLPSFRLEIRFRNGTLPSSETSPTASPNITRKRWQESSPLHQFIRRNSWSDYIYSASPSTPSHSDQEFLGQFTDNITAPYDGEETPFYLSLLNPTALPTGSSKPRLRKRGEQFAYPYPTDSDESSLNASTSVADDIPAPAVGANGEPMAHQLYPLVSAQPLRLYNRGQDIEHYGFYTYFDRSIYISGISTSALINITNTTTTMTPTTNVDLQNASAVCTFSQTRFHVQIWTRNGSVGDSPATASHEVLAAGDSTANDMNRPGSFPYPVTITLDRHGGQADRKGVYCYGINAEDHQIDSSIKMWINEDRAVGGNLIHAADIPGGGHGTSATKREENAGSIDGGSGGCSCQWQNQS